MYQFSKYHRKVQGPEHGQVYFSSIQYVKIIGEHGGVIEEHFEGWTHDSHIFYGNVKIHMKY